MYNLKVIVSGNRLEIYKVNNYAIQQGKKDAEYKAIEEFLKEDIEDISEEKQEQQEPQGKQTNKDRLRNLTDARNNIIRLIKANSDMNTFITLTFAAEQDYKDSKKSLDNLFHKLRRDYVNYHHL